MLTKSALVIKKSKPNNLIDIKGNIWNCSKGEVSSIFVIFIRVTEKKIKVLYLCSSVLNQILFLLLNFFLDTKYR